MHCDRRLARSEKWYHTAPEDVNMRMPDGLLKSVVFLCVQVQVGPNANKYQPIGTACIVGVNDSDFDFAYLVTARHILDEATRCGYSTIFARVNKKDGHFEYISLGPLNHWQYYTDKADDLALLPFLIDPLQFDCMAIPVKMLVTSQDVEERFIGVGDQVETVGLFTLHTGKKQNIPIVRSGTIATMPHEPFEDAQGREYFAFLIEMRSIGGLSGSPVFLYLDKNRIYPTGLTDEEPFSILLLGIIRGHFDLKKELADTDDMLEPDLGVGFSKGENMNVGIAVVTPASSILAMLMHDTMREIRKMQLKVYMENNQLTEDAQIPIATDDSDLTEVDFTQALKKVSRPISEPDQETKETSE